MFYFFAGGFNLGIPLLTKSVSVPAKLPIQAVQFESVQVLKSYKGMCPKPPIKARH